MGSNCFGERKKKKRAVIDCKVSNHLWVCSNITRRFGEASEDERSNSGEQGIISESRKEIKGQGKKITGGKDEEIWVNMEEKN